MSDQAQAEDRRALIRARLTGGADALHAYGRTLYDDYYERIAQTMREAEAELSRLSRVEQALRDALTKITSIGAAVEARQIAKAALSASPEAQPKEGR